MHDAAHSFIARQVAARAPFVSALEIGSRNINGGVRDLLANDCVYEGVDLTPGEGVDFVCDATVWLPKGPYDLVLCCEVFEHCADWPAIVANSFSVLMPKGVAMFTMAGPGRAPHSAVDGGPLRGAEFYANVQPSDLAAALVSAGFGDVELDASVHGDLYAVAVKE